MRRVKSRNRKLPVEISSIWIASIILRHFMHAQFSILQFCSYSNSNFYRTTFKKTSYVQPKVYFHLSYKYCTIPLSFNQTFMNVSNNYAVLRINKHWIDSLRQKPIELFEQGSTRTSFYLLLTSHSICLNHCYIITVAFVAWSNIL